MSGSLSGIPLGFDDSSVVCGAGFALAKPSPCDWDFTSSAGVRVFLRKDSPSVVAHVPDAQANSEDILESSHTAVQEALDVRGMREMHFVALKNAEYDHLLWWRDPEVVVR